MSVPQSTIEENVHIALREDVGDGDITAELIPADAVSLANVISREDCVFCGMDWFEEVFRQIDDEVYIEWHVQDGDSVASGETICSLSGPSRSLLTGERTALNFIQTLSATSTLASSYAQAVAGRIIAMQMPTTPLTNSRVVQRWQASRSGSSIP